jgi:outer membrane receptor protein involved in Fe transport
VPDRRVAGGRNGLSRAELDAIGRAFTNEWEGKEARIVPDLSLGASIGDSMETDAGRLGYVLTLGYRFQTNSTKERITNVKLEADRLVIRDELEREVGKSSSQLGLLGSASYRMAEDHELKLVALFTQTGDDQTAFTTGISDEEKKLVEQTELQFVSRRLLFGQLLGRHLELLGALDLDWQINFAWVGRDQPDTRSLRYEEGPQGFVYRSVPGSGERLFTELLQLDFGGGFDVTYSPVEGLELEAGYLGRYSARRFDARRFGHRYLGTAEEKLLAPDQLFAPDSYGTIVELLELTRPDDGYQADGLLNVGYLMADWFVLETVRLIGGARVEVFRQSIEASSPYAGEDEEIVVSTARTDVGVLPALSAILPIGETMNVRASYGGTVARPLVRELAPFLNQDFIRRRSTLGNPDLLRTYVHNFDLRWEWFPSESEVLAASLFYKLFQDPIEPVVLDQNGNITFDNIAGAQNFGGELEARVELDRIHRYLEGFNVVANFALIHSRVSLSQEDRQLATSESRPRAGQSPFVANQSHGWSPEWSTVSANVFYNVFGRRISDTGRLGLPDVYEEPFHSVDATIFWRASDELTVSLYGRNLLAQKTRVTQDDFNFLEFDQGLSFGTRIAWTH